MHILEVYIPFALQKLFVNLDIYFFSVMIFCSTP